MARHTITVYKDFWANVYSFIGGLFLINIFLNLFDGNFTGTTVSLLVCAAFSHKAENRACGMPNRYPAKAAGILLLICQAGILLNQLVGSGLSDGALSAMDIGLMLLPTVIAVILLLPAVTNKPAAMIALLLVLQAIALIPLITGIVMLSASDGWYYTLFVFPVALLPGYLALRVRAHGKNMTIAEKSRYF